MKCYLVRHGEDDNTVRGGWSNTGLTENGFSQVKSLSASLQKIKSISAVYSSDLNRARQTAEMISSALNLDVEYMPEFREVNNGDLSGMPNALAERKYPNLYWRKLAWDEQYPNGESPSEFYRRIKAAWHNLCEKNADNEFILVTHGGVINVIMCIVNHEEYSNKTAKYNIPNASFIEIKNNCT